MSNQANNFRTLCAGASISSIKQALRLVNSSVVRELGDYYGCGTDLDAIAIRLCIG